MFQIFYSPYKLERIKKANAQTDNLYQEGCLIKIIDQQGNCGYADLCPWPSLGDLTWQKELDTRGKLFLHAVELAKKDLEARLNKTYLVNELKIKNNILLTQDILINRDNKNTVINYSLKDNLTYKIKIEKKLLNEWIIFLNQESSKFSNIQWRLDFNFCLNKEEFLSFYNSLSLQTQSKIEYVEDPFLFDEISWTNVNKIVPLYLDWAKPKDNWPNRIIKPSRQNYLQVLENNKTIQNLNYKFTMTSSMDHPVGIAHGLSEAQKFSNQTHGFLTLDMYKPNSYFDAFLTGSEQLSYKSQDYGIGFTNLLEKENWVPLINFSEPLKKNELFLNSRFSENEKKELYFLKNQFEIKNSQINDVIYIPSSGSSQKRDESLKLIILKRQSLINSAQRVIDTFKLNSNDHWGCLLPLFHVGGLGVLIRSQIQESNIFFNDWSNFSIEWIQQNLITCLSLVPTQVYDLVQNKIQAPKCLKYVFIGGAELSTDLATQAKQLGWPIVITFGMTETSSMIAFKKSTEPNFFNVFEGVQIKTVNQCLAVKSNSNALGFIQLNRSTQSMNVHFYEDYIQTNDQVEIKNETSFNFIQRQNDVIKINGESVSVKNLRDLWQNLIFKSNFDNKAHILHFQHHARSENQIVIYTTDLSDELLKMVKVFNQTSVKPFEYIQEIILIAEIPKTDLNKIKYSQLSDQKNLKRVQIS